MTRTNEETHFAQAPTGWKLVPLEPTPEIIAGAAIAAWPTASAADVDLARAAAPLVLVKLDMAPGTSIELLAAGLATMAPAYRAMLAAAPAAPTMLTPLDYRAQGREEALQIILAQDPEEPFSGHTHDSANGDAGDYSVYWDEKALRELLNIGDNKHDAFGRAEAQYWDALAKKNEAERMLAMVERAPYFRALHEVLAKHQEWGLLHQLQHAAARPSSAALDVLAERRRQVDAEGYDVEHDDAHVQGEIGAYAAFYAMPPGTREWPADETGYGATWGEAIIPEGWAPPKPGDRRRELVKAGALILAEIERIDRAAAQSVESGKGNLGDNDIDGDAAVPAYYGL